MQQQQQQSQPNNPSEKVFLSVDPLLYDPLHPRENLLPGKVSMEGKMEEKFDMKPNNENFEEYGKLCRKRTKKSMIKRRKVQVFDNDRGVHMRPMPGMVGLLPSNSKDKKTAPRVKGSDKKRTRRDCGELQDVMFKLFEGQPNWALKQLVEVTDQPANLFSCCIEVLNGCENEEYTPRDP